MTRHPDAELFELWRRHTALEAEAGHRSDEDAAALCDLAVEIWSYPVRSFAGLCLKARFINALEDGVREFGVNVLQDLVTLPLTAEEIRTAIGHLLARDAGEGGQPTSSSG